MADSPWWCSEVETVEGRALAAAVVTAAGIDVGMLRLRSTVV